MTDELRERRIRRAWVSLRKWQGPWQPELYGDMSGLIDGVTMNVKVKRWIEDDGTEMAAAMCEGIELERKAVTTSEPH
jgi:hypothetical protein